jgi:MT-A70
MLDQLHSQFESGPFIGLPRGYFQIAHIDPPWTFHAWSHRGDGKGACQHYRCQMLEDIIALPIDQLMGPDAALFLWTVQPMYPEALRVIEAWGFAFRTVAFVWIKMPRTWNEHQIPLRIRPRMGLGYHTRSLGGVLVGDARQRVQAPKHGHRAGGLRSPPRTLAKARRGRAPHRSSRRRYSAHRTVCTRTAAGLERLGG